MYWIHVLLKCESRGELSKRLKRTKVLGKVKCPFLLVTPRPPKALVQSVACHYKSAVAAGDQLIHLMFDTARQPRGGLDCGGCFEGFGVDLRC